MLAGQPAPVFNLSNQHGQHVGQDDLLGAPAVLVFFPYAFSGICSSELSELESLRADLPGARLLAISVDTMYALRTFSDQLGLGFDLLSDFWPHGAVAEAYGVFDAERGCAIRGTFVLDPSGTLAWSERQPIGQRRQLGTLRAVLGSLA